MNLQMLLFKAFAIMDVVLRHRYWPFSQFMFIASSIPLFLFLSGYFYKSTSEQRPLRFVVKKFQRLILLYFAYNVFYALLTYMIYVNSGTLLGMLPSWRNFFIQPFIDGQQYALSAPMWFIPFFFTVQICYMLTSKLVRRFSNDEYAHLIVFLMIGLIGIGIRHSLVEPDKLPFTCLGLRILFGMFFISLGRCFACKIESFNVYRPKLLLLAIGARVVLFFNFKTPCYAFANADFDFTNLFYSLIDVYFILYLAKYVGGLIRPGNFLYKIGNNTFHVMANHMLVFYVFDSLLLAFTGQDPAVTSSPLWKYTWPGFLILGIVLPTGMGMMFKWLRKKIENFLAAHCSGALNACAALAGYKLENCFRSAPPAPAIAERK